MVVRFECLHMLVMLAPGLSLLRARQLSCRGALCFQRSKTRKIKQRVFAKLLILQSASHSGFRFIHLLIQFIRFFLDYILRSYSS